MREFITTIETSGKLKIEGFEEIEAICIFKDDFYSVKLKKGTFELFADSDIINQFEPWKKFIFNGKCGRTIEGVITGFNNYIELNLRKIKLNYIANEITKWIKYSDKIEHSIKLQFNIPYVSLLGRQIKNSYGFYSDYILKFISDPFKLLVNGIEITFNEKISIIKDELKSPNCIFSREIYPTVEIKLNKCSIIDTVNKVEFLISDIFLIISFLLNHRITSFGYNCEIFDNDGILVDTLNYKNYNISDCEDFFINETNFKFKNDFTINTVNKFTNNFISSKEKVSISRIINSYLSINETRIFEPKFNTSYFLLEAISKLIIKPSGKIKAEKLILKAFEKSEIDNSEINFEPSQNSKKVNWLITEYRNNLAHSNNFECDEGIIYDEFSKIVKLSRCLIIWYLNSINK